MRPKIQNQSQRRPNPRHCQKCGRDPKEVIQWLNIKTSRRRIYAGLYSVIESDRDGERLLKVCRSCCVEGRNLRFLRVALPAGAAARKHCKITTKAPPFLRKN